MTGGLPLGEAVLCLDCEIIYSIRARGCPKCGTRSAVLLSTWLQKRKGTEASR